jgi:3-hydroxybutyryl-CoA dehydrogenase
MNILVVGESEHETECKAKFGTGHHYTLCETAHEAEDYVASCDVIFDFCIEDDPLQLELYAPLSNKIVFLNTAKISLLELSNLVDHNVKATLIGFNGLPTCLNRDRLEVSLLKKSDEETLKKICTQLNTAYELVEDRVGLVTPRILCMIINEAYYTVQEGTATREDIDQAMKLGTNYPYGPFEWCARIGIKHVYEVLEAVYEDTHDERYKICSLLKREYLAL